MDFTFSLLIKNLLRGTSTDPYVSKAQVVIEESEKMVHSLNRYLEDQRKLIDSIVEWATVKNDNVPLTKMAKDLAVMSYKLEATHKRYINDLLKLKKTFMVVTRLFGEKDRLHSKYLIAYNKRVEIENRLKKASSENNGQGSAWECNECQYTLKRAKEQEATMKRELDEYLISSEYCVVTKAKEALKDFSLANIHLSRALVSLYADLELTVEAILPDLVIHIFDFPELEEEIMRPKGPLPRLLLKLVQNQPKSIERGEEVVAEETLVETQKLEKDSEINSSREDISVAEYNEVKNEEDRIEKEEETVVEEEEKLEEGDERTEEEEDEDDYEKDGKKDDDGNENDLFDVGKEEEA